MTEYERGGPKISQEDLSFQATEAVRISSLAISGGFFNDPERTRFYDGHEVEAASRFASTIITLIAEGKIAPFIPPDSGTSDTDTQE